MIQKAKSQLESYEIDNNAEKIAFIIIENDATKEEPISVIFPQIQMYTENFISEGFQIKIILK